MTVLCKKCGAAPAGSPEHIIPNALGGRLVVRNFLCERCNNALGKDVDSHLIEPWHPISLGLGHRTGKGENLHPARRVKHPVASQLLDVDANGNVRESTGGCPWTTQGTAGAITYEITATSEEQLVQRAAQVVRKEQASHVGPATSIPQVSAEKTTYPPETGVIDRQIPGDDPREFMAVAKMGLAALVRSFGREFIDQPEFDDACAFAFGDGRVDLLRGIDVTQREEIRKWAEASVGDHMLAVFTRSDKKTGGCCSVEVVFSAFCAFPYRLRLASGVSSFEGPVHVVVPGEGKHFERSMSDPPKIDPLNENSSPLDSKDATDALYDVIPFRGRHHASSSLVPPKTENLDGEKLHNRVLAEVNGCDHGGRSTGTARRHRRGRRKK